MVVCGRNGHFLPGLVVNLVSEAGCVDNGQRDARPLLVQLELWVVLASDVC